MKDHLMTRRDFLKRTTVVLAGLAMAPLIKFFPDNKRKETHSSHLKEAKHYSEGRHWAG